MINIRITKKRIIIFLIVFLTINQIIHYIFNEKDFCLDTSICPENYEINTQYGLIKLTKENCIKYGWKWIEKSKVCNMRKD